MTRRANEFTAERFCLTFEHASENSADREDKFAQPGRKFRIDKVRYVNPTGLTADAADFVDLQLLVGGNVAANWSTETGQEGTLTADTWVEFTNSATDTDMVGDADDEVSLNLDVTIGVSLTVPAGRVYVEGRYL